MDILSNMLITIKNGGNAGKATVTVPFSKFKSAVAHKLFEKGYISSHAKKEKDNHPTLEIGVAYTKSGTPKITDLKRVSKLSRRTYFGVKDIYRVRQGHGMLILSTPKGILTGKEARKEMVGGEALFEIW